MLQSIPVRVDAPFNLKRIKKEKKKNVERYKITIKCLIVVYLNVK